MKTIYGLHPQDYGKLLELGQACCNNGFKGTEGALREFFTKKEVGHVA